MLTRDIHLDWTNVPDPSSGKLPPGFLQMKILDYEDKMTSSDGVDSQGNPKIAKYMIIQHLEVVAPEEAAGLTRDEYYVVGSNEDSNMQKAETLYRKDNYGASALKGCMGSAQVPWSASLMATLQSSIGAMFVVAVTHKMEKRRDTGEDFVAARTGRTFKLGEKMPQIVPCSLPTCEDCKALRMSGAVMQPAMQAPTGPSLPPYPFAPPASGPLPNASPPSHPYPAAPPTHPFGHGGTGDTPPTIPTRTPASGLNPVSPAQPVAPKSVEPNIPSTLLCRMCGVDVPMAEFGAHSVKCAEELNAKASAGFKQET
jgi:hypothetical protein